MKIAIFEFFENRAINIKKLILDVNDNIDIDIYKVYNNEFPIFEYDAYIYSGGPISLLDDNEYKYINRVKKFTLSIDKPILGICLGCQIIAESFGGIISEASELEVGFKRIFVDSDSLLKKDSYFFNYHWDYISKLPKDFKCYAHSNICRYHIIKHKNKNIWGVQFHPEIDDRYAVDVLEYLKEEIVLEGINYDELIEDINKFNYDNSIDLMRSFLDLVHK